MSRYIIETLTGVTRRTVCDAQTVTDAHTKCTVAMSVSRDEGGPDFAYALDEAGHYAASLERTWDGRILDHLAGR